MDLGGQGQGWGSIIPTSLGYSVLSFLVVGSYAFKPGRGRAFELSWLRRGRAVEPITC